MKILYEDYRDKEVCCRTCVSYKNCTTSFYLEFFDTNHCNKYEYSAPFEVFESKDPEFIKQVINLIDKQKEAVKITEK